MCLVSLLLLAIHTADLLSNIVRGAYSGTISGSLFKNHECLNKDPIIVPKEAPLIVLDSKSAVCTAKNSKDTKHTRHIARRMHFLRNGEKCKNGFSTVKYVNSWIVEQGYIYSSIGSSSDYIGS